MLDPPFPCTYSLFQKDNSGKVALFIYVFVCKSSWVYSNAFMWRFAHLCMHTGSRRSVVFLCHSLPLPWRHGQSGTWIFWARMEAITPQQSCLWLSQNLVWRDRHLQGCLMCFLCGCRDPNSGLHDCAISLPSCWAISLTLTFFFSFLKSSYNSLLSWVEVRIFWMYSA